jgi:hypothetical protein
MPGKSSSTPKTAKTTSATTRRPASRRRSAKQSRPDHSQIAERAYFIHLEEGSSDELANWLRAERELTPA